MRGQTGCGRVIISVVQALCALHEWICKLQPTGSCDAAHVQLLFVNIDVINISAMQC